MPPDDRELIRRVLRGDEAAFSELMQKYEGRLFETIRRIVESDEDAQDVVQDTFINAFQSLASFKGDSQFFTWLYRIAYNTAIQHQRKRRNATSTQRSDDSKGRIDVCFAALQRLSPRHAFIVFLHDIARCRYAVAAEILQLPVGTVRSSAHEARLKLRSVLERAELSEPPVIGTPITDAGLAAAGVANVDAYCALMMRYARHLHDMVEELLPRSTDQAKAFGDIFLAVRQRLGTFTGEIPFVTWLHKVVAEVVRPSAA